MCKEGTLTSLALLAEIKKYRPPEGGVLSIKTIPISKGLEDLRRKSDLFILY